jgi:hypothetical protein
MLKHILHCSNFNAQFLETLLADIPCEKFAVQPPGLANHPAWIVGHLSVVRFTAGSKVLDATIDLPEAWLSQFGRGSTPTSDRTSYPTKDELLSTFRRVHSASTAQLAKTDPARFAGPHPIERLQSIFPTLGDLVVQGFVAHDQLHLGQLSDWRRANGYPRII